MSDTPHIDKERVLGVAGLSELCQAAGLELRRRGGAEWGPCPFHAERSGSFKIEDRGGMGWRFHCFGCGADGDAIDFWMRMTGLAFKEALADLARRYGLAAGGEAAPLKKVARRRLPAPEKVVSMPPRRKLSAASVEELAALRGLSVAGVQAACDAGLVWGNLFGVSERYWGESGSKLVWGAHMEHEERMGRLRVGPVRCWFLCDGERCAAIRRMDGEPWVRHDGGTFKSWSVGTKKWPCGVKLIGEKPLVALVEGEPDVLAAYHFLAEVEEFKVQSSEFRDGGATVENTAVVAVMGAACNLPDEVWPMFEGKRVRMFPHFDKAGADGQRTGWTAAEKWSAALSEAGAGVDCFYFGTDDPEVPPLRRADGEPVKDLNDAALGDADCLAAVRECFAERWSRGGLTPGTWRAGQIFTTPVIP